MKEYTKGDYFSEMRNGISLEGLCSEKKVVFVDTSALRNYSGRPKFSPPLTPKELHLQAELDNSRFHFWNEQFRNFENLFVTKRLFNEYDCLRYRQPISREETKKTRHLRTAKKTRRENFGLKNELKRFLEEDSRIFQFDKSYNEAYNKLLFKYPGILGENGKVDFDLFASGVVLGKDKIRTSIITFDFSLLNSIGRNLGSDNLTTYLSFYIPKEDFSFEPYGLLHNYSKNQIPGVVTN